LRILHSFVDFNSRDRCITHPTRTVRVILPSPRPPHPTELVLGIFPALWGPDSHGSRLGANMGPTTDGIMMRPKSNSTINLATPGQHPDTSNGNSSPPLYPRTCPPLLLNCCHVDFRCLASPELQLVSHCPTIGLSVLSFACLFLLSSRQLNRPKTRRLFSVLRGDWKW